MSENQNSMKRFVEKTTGFEFEEIKKILELSDTDNQEELISWVNSFDYSMEKKINLINKLAKITNKNNVKKQIEEFKRKFEKEGDEHEKMKKFRLEKISSELIKYSKFVDFDTKKSVKRIILELKCKESILGKCFNNLISYYKKIREDILKMKKEIDDLDVFFENLDKDNIHKFQNKTN